MFTKSSIESQQRLFKPVENMLYQLTEQMICPSKEFTNVKHILVHGAATDNKKQPPLTDIEDLLAEKFPIFKKATHIGTFSPYCSVIWEDLLLMHTFLKFSISIKRSLFWNFWFSLWEKETRFTPQTLNVSQSNFDVRLSKRVYLTRN